MHSWCENRSSHIRIENGLNSHSVRQQSRDFHNGRKSDEAILRFIKEIMNRHNI